MARGLIRKLRDDEKAHVEESAGTYDEGWSMRLEKTKFNDVNGLLGRCHRNPISGKIYLKEVESSRDFHVVDLSQRPFIDGEPDMLAGDEHLYMPKPLNYRTWVYHNKFTCAWDGPGLGRSSEAFLFEALNERCIDFDISDGRWSSCMVLFPVVPITMISGDTLVLFVTTLLAFLCLAVAVITNRHNLYFWGRPLTIPVRLAYLVFVLVRLSNGSGLEILGYLAPLILMVIDFWLGDLSLLGSQRFTCRYDVIRTLPNQVFVCRRDGDNSRVRERKRTLSEAVTGGMAGDSSLCIIANLQGLLMELSPVDREQDGLTFSLEHSKRVADPAIGPVRYLGVDIFRHNLKTIADLDVMHNNLQLLQNNSRLTMVDDPRFKELQHQAKRRQPGALDQLMLEDV
jgi:hypothetical protein